VKDSRPLLPWARLILAGTLLVLGSWRGTLAIGLVEIFGFVTGAACVLLVVRESIWNFPVGIANNVFFILLFLSARLYADMALQVVYLVLAGLGWWRWARGGSGGAPLAVGSVSAREGLALGVFGAGATALLTVHLRRIGDAAPFLDALTTVLSLLAQWLLNQKRIENWYVWIAADLLYVGLYVQRGLHLTAVLYFVFILMCVAGLRGWRESARTALVLAVARPSAVGP
jgi:nicotinamide mononucleotide transporter